MELQDIYYDKTEYVETVSIQSFSISQYSIVQAGLFISLNYESFVLEFLRIKFVYQNDDTTFG